MYYCENCNAKNVNNRCTHCGRKNLREIRDNDFCFWRKLDAVSAENIKNKLSSENIGCALVPQGTGINSILGLKLENCLVFVEYRALDYVENLMQLEKQRLSDNLKQELLDNIDKIHILANDFKKIRKRIKIQDERQLLDFCKTIIFSATEVVDMGAVELEEGEDGYNSLSFISSHYYHVRNNEYDLYVNSHTLRIYKVNNLQQ